MSGVLGVGFSAVDEDEPNSFEDGDRRAIQGNGTLYLLRVSPNADGNPLTAVTTIRDSDHSFLTGGLRGSP